MKLGKSCIVFIALTFSMIIPCFADQNESILNENYYVQPGGVYVAPDGIYVAIADQLVQVNILCADVYGIFVPAQEIGRQFVQCPHCRRWYDPEQPHNCPGPA